MEAMREPGNLLDLKCTRPSCVSSPVVTLFVPDRLVLGMQGVYKQMVEAFRSLGVEAVPGPGNPFDPGATDVDYGEPASMPTRARFIVKMLEKLSIGSLTVRFPDGRRTVALGSMETLAGSKVVR